MANKNTDIVNETVDYLVSLVGTLRKSLDFDELIKKSDELKEYAFHFINSRYSDLSEKEKNQILDKVILEYISIE